MSSAGMHDSCDEVLRLAPECDPSVLRFSPAEGYLLSRVDGYTPWRLLREIGGLPADEVDVCLADWLERGILLAEPAPDRAASRATKQAAPLDAPAPPSAPSTLPAIDESLIDGELDLAEDVQRRILEFEAGLDRNCFEVLGLSTDADRRQVKKSYFTRCRQYHPDRFFGREIGPYAQKLDRIFKRVREAYETLSSDDERAKLAEELGPISAPSEAAPDAPDTNVGEQEAKAPPSAPLSPRDRLKQRMPFRKTPEQRSEGRQKAKEFSQAALISLRRGKYLEAIASIRMALAFDASNEEYQETLGRIQREATDSQLSGLREGANSMDPAEKMEALRLCDQSILDRPNDAELHQIVARLAVDLGDFERAKDYAERAIELDEKVGSYHAILGRAFEGLCDWGRAIDELQEALGLDPGDEDSTRRLSALKWRARSKRK